MWYVFPNSRPFSELQSVIRQQAVLFSRTKFHENPSSGSSVVSGMDGQKDGMSSINAKAIKRSTLCAERTAFASSALPTRLQTRTMGSNMCASQWDLTKPRDTAKAGGGAAERP